MRPFDREGNSFRTNWQVDERLLFDWNPIFQTHPCIYIHLSGCVLGIDASGRVCPSVGPSVDSLRLIEYHLSALFGPGEILFRMINATQSIAMGSYTTHIYCKIHSNHCSDPTQDASLILYPIRRVHEMKQFYFKCMSFSRWPALFMNMTHFGLVSHSLCVNLFLASAQKGLSPTMHFMA